MFIVVLGLSPPGRGPHYSPPTTLAPPRQNQTGLAQDPQGPADPLWLCDGVPKTGHVHKNQNWNMIKGWSCTPSPCGRREAVERELRNPGQAGRRRPALLAPRIHRGPWDPCKVHGSAAPQHHVYLGRLSSRPSSSRRGVSS